MGREIELNDWTDENHLLLLESWAREGLSDRQIAEQKIGVTEDTFAGWKEESEVLRLSLKKGRDFATAAVENALLKSALGFSYFTLEPVKLRSEKYVAGKARQVEERIEHVNVEHRVAPNVSAQIFWLKNRKPHVWKDKVASPLDPAKAEKMNETMMGYRELFQNPVPDRTIEDVQYEQSSLFDMAESFLPENNSDPEEA